MDDYQRRRLRRILVGVCAGVAVVAVVAVVALLVTRSRGDSSAGATPSVSVSASPGTSSPDDGGPASPTVFGTQTFAPAPTTGPPDSEPAHELATVKFFAQQLSTWPAGSDDPSAIWAEGLKSAVTESLQRQLVAQQAQLYPMPTTVGYQGAAVVSSSKLAQRGTTAEYRVRVQRQRYTVDAQSHQQRLGPEQTVDWNVWVVPGYPFSLVSAFSAAQS